MNRFLKRFIKLVLGAFLVGCIFAPVHANAVPIDDPAALVNQITKQVQFFQKNVVDNLSMAKNKMMDKIYSWKQAINESITDLANEIQSAYDDFTKTVDSFIEEQGNKVASYVGEKWDSVTDYFAGSDAGDGFSLSETLCSFKESIQEYGKYVAPVAQATSGDVFGAVGSVRDALYTKAEEDDKLGGFAVRDIQTNLKKYVQESTRVAIGDATQIMNGTTQYKKVQKSGSCAKCGNLGEDVANNNGVAMSMNVMTNTLLSMDITELSIQSALIYDSINMVGAGSFLMQ